MRGGPAVASVVPGGEEGQRPGLPHLQAPEPPSCPLRHGVYGEEGSGAGPLRAKPKAGSARR